MGPTSKGGEECKEEKRDGKRGEERRGGARNTVVGTPMCIF